MRFACTARRSLRSAVVALGALAVVGGAGTAASAHTSIPEGAALGPAATVSAQQRQLVKTQRLADGSIARIYKVGDRYEAAIFFHGKKIATLGSKTTVFRHHGVNYSFHPYKGSVWAEKGKGGKLRPGEPIKPIPNPTPDDDVTPPGPVPAPDDNVAPPVPAPNPTPDDVVSPAPAPNPASDDVVSPAEAPGAAAPQPSDS
ncbi:hypothetical protein ACFTWH_06845 [Streptomyces sp. NPDC057011]|uniref:hypothetical protein n=1 Tax=unclassified Streptomyces TaxID=2593676 RepID=UPI00363BD2C8